MFPSFDSLSDRERQRRRLLEKTQQRLRNEAAMREAFADTIWATDNNTVPSLTKAATAKLRLETASKMPETASVQDVSMATAPSLGSKKSSVASMTSDAEYNEKMLSFLGHMHDLEKDIAGIRGDLKESSDVSMASASSDYATPESSEAKPRMKAPSADSGEGPKDPRASLMPTLEEKAPVNKELEQTLEYPKGWNPAQPAVSDPWDKTEREYLNQLNSLLKSKGGPEYITMVSGTGDTSRTARLYRSGMATTSALRAKSLSYEYTWNRAQRVIMAMQFPKELMKEYPVFLTHEKEAPLTMKMDGDKLIFRYNKSNTAGKAGMEAMERFLNTQSIDVGNTMYNPMGDAGLETPPMVELKGIGVRSGKRLKGRGLRGAGKCYNLNHIQGSGMASAYIYQPIGSKYIRVPDLDKNELSIVYPCRTKVGPKRRISDAVQRMIKRLVYEGDISQSQYDDLSIEDKRLFREIVEATHVQHMFSEKLADPIDNLKAEFDKCRGEVMLGNDNPDLIKRLRELTVDMFAQRLIDDQTFKEIIASTL